ncbi:hypothetical protein [Nocardioides sp. SYSU D00038]|uniref:hypothetical protein n=1 Tax=Nocardioides sp. SYSU D00038 TaxID=2812554 RepID=UPI001966EF64|nr:hypothetical protein [Nocardioides sp. SYSU D00038]
MSTLHDRLDDLAADAPTGSPDPDLWDRGRRYARRRRAGTAAVLAVAAVVLAVGGWRVQDLSKPDGELRPAGSTAALPDRVWEPSPWLAGTDEVGPPGRLALVELGERRDWYGSDVEPWGISAETGSYAFLDLPGRAEGQNRVTLSPDGRLVAYWLRGDPSGSRASGEEESVTGYALWDATTGEVRRHLVETEHGLSVGRLVFADAETLVAQFGHWIAGADGPQEQHGVADYAPLEVWDVADLAPRASPVLERAVGGNQIDGGGHGRIWWRTEDTVVSSDVHDAAAHVRVVPLGGSAQSHVSAVDATGRRAATIGPAMSRNVRVGEEGGTGRRVLGTERSIGVLAWLDAERLLVVRAPERRRQLRFGLSVVDPVSGESTEITATGGSPLTSTLTGHTEVAWQLAGGPTFDAVSPGHPPDPRLVLAGLLAVLVTAACVLIRWRRRGPA